MEIVISVLVGIVSSLAFFFVYDKGYDKGYAKGVEETTKENEKKTVTINKNNIGMLKDYIDLINFTGGE